MTTDKNYNQDTEHNKESIADKLETPQCISKFFSKESSEVYDYCGGEEDDENVEDIDHPDASDDIRDFSLSQLNIINNDLKIPPFFNMTPRVIPESPHHVIEEEFKANPWAMLVATIFLTKTTAKLAKPLMKQFFTDYPTPYHLLDTDPGDLESYFITLGMRKRAHMIWRMSHEFVSAKWRRASDLYGIGKYGEDAYRLFCLGHTDVEPTDRYLRLYLDWLKSQTDCIESFSQADSEDNVSDPVIEYYAMSIR